MKNLLFTVHKIPIKVINREEKALILAFIAT